MVSEEDGCHSTDVTEPSNLTSLSSDRPKQISHSQEHKAVEQANSNDPPKKKNAEMCDLTCAKGNPAEWKHLKTCLDSECKCRNDVPPSTRCIPEQDVTQLTEKTEVHEENPRTRNVRFEPDSPCVCRGHRIAYALPVKYSYGQQRPFWCRFNWKWPRRECLKTKDKTYEVKLKETQCPHYAKPFVCCEISESVQTDKPEQTKPKTKKMPSPSKRPMKRKKETAERIDIYYFDRGNSAYYLTTDCPPVLSTDKCAERTDQAATRFWAEIFGTIHIGISFVTAFVLQLLRFVLFSVVRPLTVGILQLVADYFVKPLMSITFNALIQPVLILLYNIATSIKDLCEPLAEAIGFFLREIAHLCRAIRIVEVKQNRLPCSANACT